MAYTYGSVTKCKVAGGTTRNEYECRLGYQVNSQSIENNTSNITLRLEVRSISSSYATYGYNQTTTIDGTALSAKSFDMRSTNTWQAFGERTITVTHGSDGMYSASKSGSFTTTATGTYSLKSGSASVTVNPPQIPRYANFTEHFVASSGTNTINVQWSADSACDLVQCSLNGGNWFEVGGWPQYTIWNLNPNTTYSIRTKIRRQDSLLWTESGTIYGTTEQTTPVISSFYESGKTIDSISCQFYCDYAHTYYYRINDGNWTRGSNNISSGSFTFWGLAPNTQYKIDLICRNWINEGAGLSKDQWSTIWVTTYDIAKITSVNNFNLGDSLGVYINNPSNANVVIRLEEINQTTGDHIRDICSRPNNQYNTGAWFDFSDYELDELYKTMQSGNSVKVRFTATTNGGYHNWVDVYCYLTGNQKTAHIGVSGVQKRAKVYIGVNGSVKRAVIWYGNNGRKRCI